MPSGLRPAYIAAVQAGAGEAYRVVRSEAGTWLAPNPRQAFAATLGAGGVRIEADAQDRPWNVSMALSGHGCEGDLASPAAATPEASNNRVEYRRGGLVEWYVSGPLGLEQGFTLAEPPPCRKTGGGQVSIELALGGELAPVIATAGNAVELQDSSGAVRLRYTDLYVHDATGKPLPAQIRVHDGRLALHVDDSGAAYPVVVDPLIWTEQAKLLASDGAVDDGFGYAVGVSGDTAVVGVRFLAAAYVFVRNGTAWTEQQKLIPSGPSGGFGQAVAIAGETIVIGAVNTQTMGGTDAGAAYVFVRSGGMWTEQQELTATDGAPGDKLGSSVALSGETAVVGAPYADVMGNANAGAAYVFVRSGTAWTEQQKLTPAVGTADSLFGRVLAIDGDTAVVGASREDGADIGSASVFFRSVDVWAEEATLAASDAVGGDGYGQSVGISGDTIVVGAGTQDGMAGVNSGAAYVFVRNAAMWTEEQKLTASDAAMFGGFGTSVAVVGELAVLGAPSGGPGYAYAFTRSMGMWTEQSKLSPAVSSDSFAEALAMDGNTLVVGAYLDDTVAGAGAGAAYVFALQATEGEPCATASECLSGFCAGGICCDTACGGGDPNDCQACSVAEGALSDGACGAVAADRICRNAAGDCDVAEVCDGTATTCPADAQAPDDTACTDGTCMAGVCVPESGTGGNGGSGGAATGTGTGTGTGGSGGPTGDGGCNCRTAGAPSAGTANRAASNAWWVAPGLLLAMRRRPKTKAIRGARG
jgi:hypothetical protein